MTRVRGLSYGVRLLIPGLLLAISTFGAEEGGNGAEQPVGMIFKWLHFAIIAALAYWVFGKALPPFFRRRADSISAAIERGAAAKADAEQRLKEAADKMANLGREVAAFRAQAERDASAEMERLRGVTQLDLEKIRLAAKAEMEAAERAARVELKELAAKLAVDGAESLIAKQMTPAVQEAMINSFVKSLQGRPN
jgi:F-type H+-transporting ATPase subunit b